jgi:hypothetical protein
MWGTWPLCQGMPPSYWSRWLGDRRSWQEPSSKPKNPPQPQLWCPQVLLLSSSPKHCECLARPLDLFCSGSQTELLFKPVVFSVFEDRRPTSYTHPSLLWQCYVQPCMVLFPLKICFSQDCVQLRYQSLSSGGSVSSPPPRVRSRSPRRRSVSPVIRRARSLSRSPVPRREHRASPVANGYSILLLVLNIYKVLLYCDSIFYNDVWSGITVFCGFLQANVFPAIVHILHSPFFLLAPELNSLQSCLVMQKPCSSSWSPSQSEQEPLMLWILRRFSDPGSFWLHGFVSFLEAVWKVFNHEVVCLHMLLHLCVFVSSVWVRWACFCNWVAMWWLHETLGYGLMKESIGLLSSIESAGFVSRTISC